MKTASSLIACLVLVAFVVAGAQPCTKAARAPILPGTARSSAKAVLQEYISAWNLHNPSALDKLLDSESVHEDIPAGFRGKGPTELRRSPPRCSRLSPNGPVTGQKISARGSSFAVVEGGRIKRFVDYYDFASAFPAPSGGAR